MIALHLRWTLFLPGLEIPFVNEVYMASRAHCSFGKHRCLAGTVGAAALRSSRRYAKIAAPSPIAHALFATILIALLDEHDIRKARKKR